MDFGISFSVIVEVTDIKYGLLSKYLFHRTQQHGGCKKPQGYDQFVSKIMSSNYHIEQKTFIEASFTNNIHTWEEVFLQLPLSKVCKMFLFRQSEKNGGIIWFI